MYVLISEGLQICNQVVFNNWNHGKKMTIIVSVNLYFGRFLTTVSDSSCLVQIQIRMYNNNLLILNVSFDYIIRIESHHDGNDLDLLKWLRKDKLKYINSLKHVHPYEWLFYHSKAKKHAIFFFICMQALFFAWKISTLQAWLPNLVKVHKIQDGGKKQQWCRWGQSGQRGVWLGWN